MSIRIDTATDNVYATLGTAPTIGTGAFSLGIWVKPLTDPNAMRAFATLSNVAQSLWLGFISWSNGDGFDIYYSGGSTGGVGAGFTLNTWYFLVLSRDGSSNLHFRSFNEAGTRLINDTIAAETTNYASMTKLYVGENNGFGESGYDAEYTVLKLHTAVEWSDAECVTESTKFDIQKTGGTDRLAWGMETTTADSYGLNERSAGTALTNNGAVNGASRPSVLETAGVTTYEDTGADGMKLGESLSYIVRPSPSTCRIVSVL